MKKTQSRGFMTINVLKEYIIGLIDILDTLKTPTDKLKQLVNKFENTNKEPSVKEIIITVSHIDELNNKWIKNELTTEQFIEDLVKVLNTILE